MSKIIAVYGSLKSGHYNNPMIMSGKLLFKDTIMGTMYSLGSYPAFVFDGYDKHEVEVWEVSEQVYDRVVDMEIGAGYDIKSITLSGVQAEVFVASDSLLDYCKQNCRVIKEY